MLAGGVNGINGGSVVVGAVVVVMVVG